MNHMLHVDVEKHAVVYRTSVEDIRPLRHRLLRPGLPPESAHFENDERGDTWHLAVFHSLATDMSQDSPIVSCASFMFEPYQLELAWRLRGMCTDPLYEGCGFGSLLLKTAEKVMADDSKVRLFWCNARTPAVGFYEKQGWIIASEEFDIPTAGPHRRMYKRLA
jgi:GNAT superfamily N-acetyltransferase